MQKSHFMAREGEVKAKGANSSCVTEFVRSHTSLRPADSAHVSLFRRSAPQTIASGAGRRKSFPLFAISESKSRLGSRKWTSICDGPGKRKVRKENTLSLADKKHKAMKSSTVLCFGLAMLAAAEANNPEATRARAASAQQHHQQQQVPPQHRQQQVEGNKV